MNVFWYPPIVDRKLRENIKGHRSIVVWFTGLPCSGKSTIAHKLEEKLLMMNIHTYTLDGDNIRHGLCSDLGFSYYERREHLRRVAEVSKLFIDAGIVVLAAFVTPYNELRVMIREIIGSKDFIEIYCKCPIDVCIKRDKKGLYKKALEGKVSNYTGISDIYEEPESPDLILETDKLSIDEAVNIVYDFIKPKIKEF